MPHITKGGLQPTRQPFNVGIAVIYAKSFYMRDVCCVVITLIHVITRLLKAFEAA